MPLLTLEVTALEKDPHGGPDWAELTLQLVGTRDQAILKALVDLVARQGYVLLAVIPADWALQIKTRDPEVDATYATIRAFAEARGIDCDRVAGGFSFNLPLTNPLAQEWDQLMAGLNTGDDAPAEDNPPRDG